MHHDGSILNPPFLLPDLKAEIARHWDRPLYQLAAASEIHPANLSAILHGRIPLRPELAQRILTVLARAKEQRNG
jgi:plasmid maintenance system antidote protein VapI